MNSRYRVCGVRGYTLMEVIVTLSLISIAGGVALPHFDAQRVQVLGAQSLVLANVRGARMNAITKSVHFQVSFPTANAIRVAAMMQNPPGSGIWQVDPSKVQTTPLPAATQIAPGSVGTSIEFNSYGMPINLTAPKQIDTVDKFGVKKSVSIWLSGQVGEV